MIMARGVSTNAAAARVGLTPGAFRSAMYRARQDGLDCRRPRSDWPDGRTPMWDLALLRRWLRSRPGQGARTDLEGGL